MFVEEVRIKTATLRIASQISMSTYLRCEASNREVVFQNFISEPEEWDSVRRILEIAGVERWKDLPGKYVHMKICEERIVFIGDPEKDLWLSVLAANTPAIKEPTTPPAPAPPTPELQVGDVVELKSGSPKMTIVSVDNFKDGKHKCTCQNFVSDDRGYATHEFSVKSLHRVLYEIGNPNYCWEDIDKEALKEKITIWKQLAKKAGIVI